MNLYESHCDCNEQSMGSIYWDGVEETDNFMSCRQLEVLLRYLDFSIIEYLFIYLLILISESPGQSLKWCVYLCACIYLYISRVGRMIKLNLSSQILRIKFIPNFNPQIFLVRFFQEQIKNIHLLIFLFGIFHSPEWLEWLQFLHVLPVSTWKICLLILGSNGIFKAHYLVFAIIYSRHKSLFNFSHFLS